MSFFQTRKTGAFAALLLAAALGGCEAPPQEIIAERLSRHRHEPDREPRENRGSEDGQRRSRGAARG